VAELSTWLLRAIQFILGTRAFLRFMAVFSKIREK